MSDSEPDDIVPQEAPEEADIEAMLDLSKKKKKAKKKKDSKKDSKEGKSEKQITQPSSSGADESVMAEQQARLSEEMDAFDNEYADEHDRKAEYSYDDLLDRVMDILTSNNPDLIEKYMDFLRVSINYSYIFIIYL